MNSDFDWDRRANLYNQLEWAKQSLLLDRFIEFAEIKADHKVLDVGTGTGLVAIRAAQKTNKVTGIDISAGMLQEAENAAPQISFRKADARALPFSNATFDRVLARMVFHHMTTGLADAFSECGRALALDGVFVLAEGVPPSHEVADEYKAIFRLKEDRLTFFPEELLHHMEKAGFTNCRSEIVILPQISVKNWLANSACEPYIQQQILNLHLQARLRFKEIYHMTESKDDCRIDMMFCMVKGTKGKTLVSN
jgi:SAM-dependent methyltransferase